MPHRVAEITWLPRSTEQWATFSAARKEAAAVWKALVDEHARLRHLHHSNPSTSFPSLSQWDGWLRGRFPNLHSHSIQQLLDTFLEAVRGTFEARKAGHKDARFPWRTPRYLDVPYTNQGAKIVEGRVRLPNGKAGYLWVDLPKGMRLPAGRLMEATLQYGTVRLVFCDEPVLSKKEKASQRKAKAAASQNTPPAPPVSVGIDPGVNTLLAATDGEKAVLVSGREAKATVRYRAKRLGSIQQAQSKKKKGSKRHKRLQRAKHRVLRKTKNKLKDICHKATRIVADAFPNAHAVIGEGFNEAASRKEGKRKLDRKRAQQVSQACTKKIRSMLGYKLASCRPQPEAYTSRTCCGCGARRRCRREYACKGCGLRAPRDVVGAVNNLQLGQVGAMVPRPGLAMPRVVWRHPTRAVKKTYPGLSPGSAGGTPAGSREAACGSDSASSPRSSGL